MLSEVRGVGMNTGNSRRLLLSGERRGGGVSVHTGNIVKNSLIHQERRHGEVRRRQKERAGRFLVFSSPGN